MGPLVASAGGDVHVTITEGPIVETTDLTAALQKTLEQKRNGYAGESDAKVSYQPRTGHGVPAGVFALGHNALAAAQRLANTWRTGRFPRSTQEAVQTQRKLDSAARANVSAAAPGGKLATLASRVSGVVQSKILRSSIPHDSARYLTDKKLQKGAVADTVAELTDGFPESVQTAVRSAYTGLPMRDKPAAYNNAVLVGEWKEIGFGIAGNVGLKAATLKDAPLKDVMVGIGASLDIAQRTLPAQLYMAPHNFVDTSCAGERATQTLKALRESPDFQSYLAYKDALSAQPDAPAVVKRLEDDVALFEDRANRLLAGGAMAISRVGAVGAGAQMVKQSARDMANAFFPGMDPRHLVEEATSEPEQFISRCWNALSLGVQDASARLAAAEPAAGAPAAAAAAAAAAGAGATGESSAALTEALDQVKQRVENPNILMSADVLHTNSVLPATGELFRDRLVANLGVDLPLPLYGGSLLTHAKAAVKLTVDDVDGHPNPVRNGKFLQVDLDLSGIPGVPIAIDKVASALTHLDINPGIRSNLAGFSFGAALPEMAKANLASAGDVVNADGSHEPQFHTMPFDAGLQFTGGSRYTLLLHKASHKADATPGAAQAPARDAAVWKPMFAQQASTSSVDASFGIGATVATGLGANAHIGISTSNSDTQPNLTVLFPEPSIHLLQYSTLKKQLHEIDLMNKAGELTLHALQQGTPEQENSRNLLTQKYFANNNSIADIVSKFAAIRGDAALGGRAVATARDDFSALIREGFNEQHRGAYLHDEAAPALLAVRHAAQVAKQETAGMSPAHRFRYYTSGESPEGALVMQEYVRGMNAFNKMKFNAYFNPGNTIKAPFLVRQLNPNMALRLAALPPSQVAHQPRTQPPAPPVAPAGTRAGGSASAAGTSSQRLRFDETSLNIHSRPGEGPPPRTTPAGTSPAAVTPPATPEAPKDTKARQSTKAPPTKPDLTDVVLPPPKKRWFAPSPAPVSKHTPAPPTSSPHGATPASSAPSAPGGPNHGPNGWDKRSNIWLKVPTTPPTYHDMDPAPLRRYDQDERNKRRNNPE